MEKINVAELLKDCPKGMELDCTMFDGVYFDHVDDLRLNRIKCYVNNGDEHFEIEFEESGQYISNDSAKCVIFPKGKTTWEGFVPNKFDITTLVPFESRVLVRNDKDQYWIPAFWGCKRSDGYTTTFGWCKYCIPYEGNEHLLETNKDCDEYYKTWK